VLEVLDFDAEPASRPPASGLRRPTGVGARASTLPQRIAFTNAIHAVLEK